MTNFSKHVCFSRLPVPGEGNGGTDFLAAAGFPGKFARLPRTRREPAPCLSLSRERAENRAIVSPLTSTGSRASGLRARIERWYRA